MIYALFWPVKLCRARSGNSTFHAFPLEGENLRLTRKAQHGEFVSTGFGQSITDAAVKISDLRLIVLDHAALLHGGEFNAKEDVTLTMCVINKIAKDTDLLPRIDHA